MIHRPFAGLLLCLGAFVGLADAAQLPVPTVEYSADRIVETEAGTFHGKVYSSRGKERSETEMGGMRTIMILRPDLELGWSIMPAQRMYMKMDFAQAQQQGGAAPADQVDITEIGSETVEGFATTKYKLVMKSGDAGGFMWITADGVPVKMDLLSKEGRKKTRMTITLQNLEIGPQDPQLFELPAGYSAMPNMGGFGMGKGMNNALPRIGR